MRKTAPVIPERELVLARQKTQEYIKNGTPWSNPKIITVYNRVCENKEMLPMGMEMRDTLTESLCCFTPIIESSIPDRKIFLRQCLRLIEVNYNEYLGDGYHYIPYYRSFIKYNISHQEDHPLRMIHSCVVFYHGDVLSSFLQWATTSISSVMTFIVQCACEIAKKDLQAILIIYLPRKATSLVWEYFTGTF